MAMNWTNLFVRIDWTRCGRRRWPPTPTLAFTPQERRKRRNVLLFWWAGRGHRQLPEGDVEIRPGACHWARPGWTYHCTQSPRNPLGVTSIHFDLVDRRGQVVSVSPQQLPPEQLRVGDFHLVAEVTRWIAERAMDARAGVPLSPAMEAAANALLRGLLMELVRSTSAGAISRPAGLAGWRNLTSYIQGHLHDLPSVGQLARRAGYARSHFSRAFKGQTGLSPQQYIINARIALAKELLRGTALSVTEISRRVGYPDVYRLSRQFRQHVSMTPSRYRLTAGQ